MLQEEPYVSVEDLAKHFSVHANTVRSWVKNNTIPHLKVGGVYRFKISKVEEALKALVEESGIIDDRQIVINFDPNEDF